MSEAKFTPGPWCVNGDVTTIRCASGDWPEVHVHVGTYESRGNSIATVRMGGPGALHSDVVSIKANAALIAAAPELYEAASLIFDVLGDWEHRSPNPKAREAIAAIRTALAKARGE